MHLVSGKDREVFFESDFKQNEWDWWYGVWVIFYHSGNGRIRRLTLKVFCSAVCQLISNKRNMEWAVLYVATKGSRIVKSLYFFTLTVSISGATLSQLTWCDSFLIQLNQFFIFSFMILSKTLIFWGVTLGTRMDGTSKAGVRSGCGGPN